MNEPDDLRRGLPKAPSREELNRRVWDSDTTLEGHIDHCPRDQVVGTGDRAVTQARLVEVWERISGRRH